jgi:hypothetical protein
MLGIDALPDTLARRCNHAMAMAFLLRPTGYARAKNAALAHDTTPAPRE